MPPRVDWSWPGTSSSSTTLCSCAPFPSPSRRVGGGVPSSTSWTAPSKRRCTCARSWGAPSSLISLTVRLHTPRDTMTASPHIPRARRSVKDDRAAERKKYGCGAELHHTRVDGPSFDVARLGCACREPTAGARQSRGRRLPRQVVGLQRRPRWTPDTHPCRRRACETLLTNGVSR
jgi:hypothetical protein